MILRFMGVSAAVLLIGIGASSLYSNAGPKEAPKATASEKKSPPVDTYLFNAILDTIKENYVEPTTDDKLLTGALNGMLSALDPHSVYLEPKAYEELKAHTKGEFGGLGMEVTMENGLVKIISPIDDTPAQKAGLQSGDLIVAIDKKPVSGMTLVEAVDLLRGEPGMPVVLHIKREGKDVFESKLKRATIHVKAVKWRTEGNVGYIRIATFDENTVSLIKTAIEDLKKQLGSKLEGLVLDVRNDPGGLYVAAIEASELFLNKGQEIVSTKGRNPKMDSSVYAEKSDMLAGLPIVVLINGGTASAPEILAGALQDNHRAVIVGTKSFGKGSVQILYPLTNGGAIKLTIARYFTPSGRSIQAKGIEPDIKIDQVYSKLEKVDEKDRIREEDFIGALDTPQQVKKENLDKQDEKKKEAEKLDPEKKGEKKELEDYQLMRSLDIVRTMAITERYEKMRKAKPAA